MPTGASRLGFWFLNSVPVPVPIPPLDNACDLFPDYTYDSLYAQGDPTTDSFIVNNNWITYSLNGYGQGAIGDYTTKPGIQYSPLGNGNFGKDDYLAPGNPWEAFAVKAGSNTIGGTNSGTPFPTGALIWDLGGPNNHYAVLRGSAETGWVIVQYMTYPGEPIIRMRMTYQNTTGDPQTVKMMRGLDVDIDVNTYGSYDTNNQRGLDTIPATDLVISIGQYSGKPLTLYCPGGGYTHNTAVMNPWPTYNFDSILAGTDVGDGDNAICCAWDLGVVADGESASVCCFYICTPDVQTVIEALGY